MKNDLGCIFDLIVVVVLIIFMILFIILGLQSITNFDTHTTKQHAICYSGDIKIYDSDIYVWPGLIDTYYNLDKKPIKLGGDCIFLPKSE